MHLHPARLVLLLALVLLPSLAAAAPSPLVGTWKLDAVRTKAGPVPKEKLANGGMTWEFKQDGTLVMTVWQGATSKSANATWKTEAAALTVVENGVVQKMTFKKVGEKLELAGAPPSTVVMTFVKSK